MSNQNQGDNMRIYRLFTLIILTAVVVTACSVADNSAPPSESTPLKIGWSLFPGWYPMAIALDQGIFDKHGVEVEPVFYDVYSAQMSDFQAGALDGALFTLGDALLMDGRVPDSLRVVLVTDNSVGADAIVTTSDIESVADLEGKAIGTTLGSFGELLVWNMLETNDMTPEDVTLTNVDPELVPRSIPSDIQAGHVWEPFISEAVSQGYHIIFSSAQTPGLIPDLLVIRTEVSQERKEDVRAFIDAWFEAVAWWQANPDAGNAIIAEYTGLQPEEVSAEGVSLFDLNDNLHAFAPGDDTTSLYFSGDVNIEFLISTGGLSNAPSVDRLLDASFITD